MMMNVILILVVVLLATVIVWLIRATDNNNLEQPKINTEPIEDVANDDHSLFVQRLPILDWLSREKLPARKKNPITTVKFYL